MHGGDAASAAALLIARARGARDLDALARLCAAHTADTRVFAEAAHTLMELLPDERPSSVLSAATCDVLADAALAALQLPAGAAALIEACALLHFVALRTRVLEPQALLAPSLVAAMRRHSGDAKLLAMACLVLREAETHAAWRTCAVAAGAPQAVMAALSLALRCVGSSDEEAAKQAGRVLLYNGSRALGALLLADMSPAAKAQLQAAGATPALVAAMRAHGADAIVQQRACVSLALLLADSPQPQAALTPAVASDAVDAVLASLSGHPTVPGLAAAACNALACLWPAAHSVARRGAAAAAVCAAMGVHHRNADVAAAACCALQNFATAGITQAGDERYDALAVTRAVHGALFEHPRAQEVQRNGRDAIRELARAVQHASPEDFGPAVAMAISALRGGATLGDAVDAAMRARFPDLAAQHDANSAAAAAAHDVCSCAGCGAVGAVGARLKRCAACGIALYCSKACQVADWKAHRKACRAAKDETPAVGAAGGT
jgi:hypothetical protein